MKNSNLKYWMRFYLFLLQKIKKNFGLQFQISLKKKLFLTPFSTILSKNTENSKHMQLPVI